jgi:2-polyprenyl-3-methyl-5-hydroxy-6-metoxy-1,4-benzoquinol methylase
MTIKSMLCKLCHGDGILRYSGHPGYIYNSRYDIYECKKCGASFIFPMDIQKEEYDLIYSHAEYLPGYDKYYYISKRIRESDEPLHDLMNYGEEYAFIARRLMKTAKKCDRVLEIGCGLGYLTYALRKEGYDVKGVDISMISIKQALELYGPYYECCDITEKYEKEKGVYKYIILSEVIEHVKDPISFLRKMKYMLTEEGVILLTTPNKTAFPKNSLWMTDAPPIHLWWFTEKSVVAIAKKAALKATLFKGYVSDKISYHYWKKQEDLTIPVFVPKFDNGGKLLKTEEVYEIRADKKSIMRHIYAKYMPEISRKSMITVRNMLFETQKTNCRCTMLVEVKNVKQKDE